MANLNSVITKEFSKLVLSYRKEWDDQKIMDMAEVTASVLKYVPGDKMAELFQVVRRESKYFPDDHTILKTWMRIRGTAKSIGFYDSWGVWFRLGTYYNWITRPLCEWILDSDLRLWTLKIKYENGDLNESELEEWDILKLKEFEVCKGQTQKPRHLWTQDDDNYQERFNSDYDSLRRKYMDTVELNSNINKNQIGMKK